MIAVGIHSGHDASVCVIVDGVVRAAVSEERLSRVKGHKGFPLLALPVALKLARCQPSHVDVVAIVGNRGLGETLGGEWAEICRRAGRQRQIGGRTLGHVVAAVDALGPGTKTRNLAGRLLLRSTLLEHGLGRAKHEWIDHHLAHAWSAYGITGWPGALVITVDGKGDGLSHVTWQASGHQLTALARSRDVDSIGFLFAAVTETLGFVRLREEGKVTGLAAYAKSDCAHVESPVRFDARRGTLRNRLLAWHERSALGLVPALLSRAPSGLARRLLETPNIPARHAYERLTAYCAKHLSGQPAADVAKWGQTVLETQVGRLIEHWVERTGEDALCLAGGTFANVRLNQHVRESSRATRLFVQPAMGDGGLSLGAAIHVHHQHLAARRTAAPVAMPSIFMGRDCADGDLARLAAERHLAVTCVRGPDLIARAIALGAIVGRCAGRSEWGPRALGNRSILADPRSPTVAETLNRRLRRSDFMPFAPAVLDRYAAGFFEGYNPAQHAAEFMTATYVVRQVERRRIPAVVHVDGTARPQVVTRETTPELYSLIEAFQTQTGVPMVVNTSFNMHEEPIIDTPIDALDAYQRGAVDLIAGQSVVVARASDLERWVGVRDTATLASR